MAEPDYIDGVFNYCDRWCERCSLTARCRLYAMEREQFPTEATRDPENEEFWQALHGVFAQTRTMLEAMLREAGLDPEEVVADTSDDDSFDFDRALQHRLPSAARDYAMQVEQWFGDSGPLFEEAAENLQADLSIDGVIEHVEARAVGLQDAVEVIRWYQFQIAAKLTRATAPSPLAEMDDPDLVEADRRDADGSTKVALLAIDRSIAAWLVLHRRLGDDDILPLLAQLERLRGEVEAAFPHARDFVRPGFDTGEAR